MTEKNNSSTHSEVVLEAALLRVKYIESLPDIYVEHSADFDQRLEAAMRGEIPNNKGGLSRRFKILLVAAIIAVFALAATACIPIIRYVIQKYEDRYSVTVPDDEKTEYPDTVERVLRPAYLPTGCEVLSEDITTLNATLMWMIDEDIIILTQDVVAEGGIFNYDNDVTYCKMQIEKKEVYYYSEHGAINFIWEESGYLMFLSIPEFVGFENGKQIILSIE